LVAKGNKVGWKSGASILNEALTSFFAFLDFFFFLSAFSPETSSFPTSLTSFFSSAVGSMIFTFFFFFLSASLLSSGTDAADLAAY